MKLQLALDILDLRKAVEIVRATYDYIDIIEIGTPLVKYHGIGALKRMRASFPEKEILVDLKTMDVGQYEADFCFDFGADLVTVLGVADIETIKGSLKSAQNHGKKIVVDMINHPDKQGCVLELNTLGVDFIAVHSGIDQQAYGENPLDELKAIQSYTTIPLCVAGGIQLSTLDSIVQQQPHTIIVGGAITSSDKPVYVAKTMKEMML